MQFTFTGTGTSQGIPVIACECEVCLSQDPRDNRLRTSGVLSDQETTLVFDTGPDFRQQMLRYQVKDLNAVLFTHSHKDHTAGLDDVRAYNFRYKRNMPIYANAATLKHLRREYYYIFENQDYPGLPRLELNEIDTAAFPVGTMEVLPIPIWHGRMAVLGFRVNNFAYLTDTNRIPPASMDLLQGLEVLVLDALRKEKHPSHFSLGESLEVIEALKPRRAFLTHLSHLMGTHAEVEATLPDSVRIAYDGLVITGF